MANMPWANRSLIPLISALVRSAREIMQTKGGVELIVPHLSPLAAIPLQAAFSFSYAGDNGENKVGGTLAASGTSYLVEAAVAQSRVFSISPSFRADSPQSNRLIEFTYLDCVSRGGFDSAIKLAENILAKVIENGLRYEEVLADRWKESLTRIKFPLPRIKYSDALKVLEMEATECLEYSEHVRLLSHYGNKPLFLVNPSAECMNNASVMRASSQGTFMAFQLLLPFAGESLVGGELANEEKTLTKQVKTSRGYADAIQRGLTWSNFKPLIKSIVAIPAPSFVVGGGLERLTQFVLGVPKINQASVFPVDFKTLRKTVIVDYPSCC